MSALLASGIITVLVAGFVAFSRLTSKNAAAFRLLLAAAILGALMSLVSVLILTRYGRKAVTAGGRTARQVTELREDTASQIAALTHELTEKIDALDHQFPSIDWSFDAAEHDRSVYERMRKVVENDDTMQFTVLTVFRDARSEEVTGTQRSAIQRYYQSQAGQRPRPIRAPGPGHPRPGLARMRPAGPGASGASWPARSATRPARPPRPAAGPS